MGPTGSKVIEVKGQNYFFLLVMFFFLFVPLFLPEPWADLKGQGHRGQRSNFCISAVLGPIGSKVIEVKGQIYGFFLLVMLCLI